LIFVIIKFGDDAWNTITMIAAIMRQLLVNAIESVVDRWIAGFDGIVGAIRGVIDWVGNLTSKLMGLRLPSWLTPGSPTPLELGIRGISDAMGGLVKNELKDFSAGINIPGTENPIQVMDSANHGGAVTVVYSPTISLASQAEVENILIPMIRRAMRAA